jgi:hypothetical protein
MGIIGIILLLIAAAFVGFLIGIGALKLFGYLLQKKMVSEAKKVLNGTRKNLYELDGKMREVNKFALPGDKDEDEEGKFDINELLEKIMPTEEEAVEEGEEDATSS